MSTAETITKTPYFGVAGFPPAFFESEYKKKRENIFSWLKELGLNWVELQNTYGVKMKDEQALLYKDLALENGIGISLHAPYYITLASENDDVVKRSQERIVQCFELAHKIGSKRIIFHPGHFPGESIEDRDAAIDKITSALNAVKMLRPSEDILVYPETAGKKSQIGSVDEIIKICINVDYARPCIDVAHVHGFNGGTLVNEKSIIDVLDKIEANLGSSYLIDTHFHMYPVEIDANGEKKHRAFHDRIKEQQLDLFGNMTPDKYYPLAEDFIGAVKYKNITPVIICEARDSQDKGALLMRSIYFNESF
jgi:deoxyribonuclease-4